MNIYNSLIGSIFNYAFFTLANISKVTEKLIQRVQNRAIRCIYRLDWNCLNSDIFKISNVLPIKSRFRQLGSRYLARSILHNRFIIINITITIMIRFTIQYIS